MKKAAYHTDTTPKVQPLFYKEKNADGTVDLLDGNGQLVIGKCQISPDPQVGRCVLEPEAPAPQPDKK